MKKAIFFDRDGVINSIAGFEDGKPLSPKSLDELSVSSDAEAVLSFTAENGFLNIVITNQPDISRKLLSKNDLTKIHENLFRQLKIDDILVCPHDDADECNCRKPKPGMLLDAAKKWDIDLKKSIIIGDQWKDIQAGKAAGCRTILIDYPYNQDVTADLRIKKLAELKTIISSERG